MIARIMGIGQYEIPDENSAALNDLDDSLTRAVEANDEEAFRRELGALIAAVKEQGKALPDDFLGPSDFVLPGPDVTIEEVKELLGEQGLVPD